MGHVEHRLPQDGQFTVDLTGDSISFVSPMLSLVKKAKKSVYGYWHQLNKRWIRATPSTYGAQLYRFRQALRVTSRAGTGDWPHR